MHAALVVESPSCPRVVLFLLYRLSLRTVTVICLGLRILSSLAHLPSLRRRFHFAPLNQDREEDEEQLWDEEEGSGGGGGRVEGEEEGEAEERD